MRILNQELANAFFLYGLKIEKRCFKKSFNLHADIL